MHIWQILGNKKLQNYLDVMDIRNGCLLLVYQHRYFIFKVLTTHTCVHDAHTLALGHTMRVLYFLTLGDTSSWLF